MTELLVTVGGIGNTTVVVERGKSTERKRLSNNMKGTTRGGLDRKHCTLTQDVEGGRSAGDSGKCVGDATLVLASCLSTHALQHQVPSLSQHTLASVRV